MGRAPESITSILDFDRPPVAEVALAIQFEQPTVETLDVAAFAERIRTEYPQRSEQPARPPMGERFEGPAAPPVQFELLPGIPMPRFWLLSEDGMRLVQLQQDLLAHNWRKMDAASDYPRYSNLREAFSRYVDILQGVLTEAGKANLAPNWCEVTYINHIPATADSDRLALDDVLTTVRPIESPSSLPAPEDAQYAARFRIEEGSGPIGRLTLSAAPAVSAADGSEIWTLTLTARARASEPTVSAAFARLDLCHEWVVRGFYDSTAQRMHEAWGLRGAVA